jgi:hypothetical protein
MAEEEIRRCISFCGLPDAKSRPAEEGRSTRTGLEAARCTAMIDRLSNVTASRNHRCRSRPVARAGLAIERTAHSLVVQIETWSCPNRRMSPRLQDP